MDRYCGICVKSNNNNIKIGDLYLLEFKKRPLSIHVFNMDSEHVCDISSYNLDFIIVAKLPDCYTGAGKYTTIFARRKSSLQDHKFTLYQISYMNGELYIDDMNYCLNDVSSEYDFVTIDEDAIKPQISTDTLHSNDDDGEYINKEYIVPNMYLKSCWGFIPFRYPIKEVSEPGQEILKVMEEDYKLLTHVIKKLSSPKKNDTIVVKVEKVGKMNANKRVYTTKRDIKIPNTHLLFYNKKIILKGDNFPYHVHEINTVEDEYLVYHVSDTYLKKAEIYTKDELEEKFDCENLNKECIILKARCIESHRECNDDYMAKGASYKLILTPRVAAVNTGMDNLAIFQFICEDNKYDCLFEYFAVDVYYKNGETEKYLYTINDDEDLHRRYLYDYWEGDKERIDRIEEAKKLINYKNTIKIECLETEDCITLSSDIPALLYSRKTFKRVSKYLAKMLSSNKYWLTFRCDISDYCKPLIIENKFECKSDVCENFENNKNAVVFKEYNSQRILVKAEFPNLYILRLDVFTNVMLRCLKDIFPELELGSLDICVEPLQ